MGGASYMVLFLVLWKGHGRSIIYGLLRVVTITHISASLQSAMAFVDVYGDGTFSTHSDFEEESDEESGRSFDTTAAQARQGKDMQGIHWDRLRFSREGYRETRLKQYRNYENLNLPHGELEKEFLQVRKGGRFYEFRHNTRAISPTIVHFQLRNLLWATSKHDVYLVHEASVLHWSPLTHKSTEVLNVSGVLVPTSQVPAQPLLGQMQISCICVHNNLLVAGGFDGELLCKSLDQSEISFCIKSTFDENAITNAIEIYEDVSGATHLMSSNNDHYVRILEAETFETLRKFRFPWPVNHTSVSPDKRLVVVVGDNPDAFLADYDNGKVLATLKGHLDYSFASAWHPNGFTFATGNQDTSCRLWDVRNLSKSVAVLSGRIGAIRSLRFSTDGQFLAMAEPADFVHIVDVKQDFKYAQEIDFFGEIAGISLSPDTEALFIGVSDNTYGSVLEFNRKHVNLYLNSI